jgi:hypothetical protein
LISNTRINNKKDAIKYFLRKYLRKRGNLILSQRLFVVNNVLDWIFKSTNDRKVINSYIIDLENYIKGYIELSWIEKIINKKERKVDNDYKKSKTKEKGSSRE